MMPYAEWMTGVAIALERINQRLAAVTSDAPRVFVTQKHYAVFGELPPPIAAALIVQETITSWIPALGGFAP